MRITFLSVGGVKKPYMREAVEEYLKRINRYVRLETVDIKEESSPSMPKEDILKREAERILSKVREGDFLITLSDGGKAFTSREFSEYIEGLLNSGRKGATFIVGGAWGLHESVYKASNLVLSLSRMTLPHDLARLVLAEQVYRAFTIMRGEPYSH